MIEVQEARSKCFSLGQNLLKLLQVLQKERRKFNRDQKHLHTHTPRHMFYPPVSDLGAAIETEQLNISAVLGKSSAGDKNMFYIKH